MRGGRIAIVGDRNPGLHAHVALEQAMARLPHGVTAAWLPTETLAADPASQLAGRDGVLVAPGSPYRSLDGALGAIRHARESGLPLFGT
jgi:CTP synthase (UTP-ammonia lyase)